MYKVLVIAYYYPPLGLSGVQRTLKFTKYFKDFNWQATVITTGQVSYYAHDDSLLKEAIDAGVKIIRTNSVNPNSLIKSKGTLKMPSTTIMKIFSRLSKFFFIPDNKILWSRKAAKLATNLLKNENFDAIFISAPPFSSFNAFIKVKVKFGLPLFLDYRDAWHDNQFRFYPTLYHRYRHKKLEDKVLRKADRIIVVNRIIKESLLSDFRFLNFKDIDIIPHGYDPNDFNKIMPFPKENKKLILTYSGIFYEDISPKFLLKAFKRLRIENPDIASNFELHFIGYLKRENQKLISKLKLENFVIEIGYVNHSEVIKRIISSDVLWLMLPNSKRMFNVSPGKLYEYFGTGKPILGCLPDGTAKTSLKEYGAAFITSPDDIIEIKETLIRIHQLFISDKLPKPNQEIVQKYDRMVLTDHLTKIFQFYLRAD